MSDEPRLLHPEPVKKPPSPSVLAGLPRSWLLFEAGRALLDVRACTPLGEYPNELMDRIANLAVSFITLSGVCNIPSEQAIAQIDAQIRQTLPLLYFLEGDDETGVREYLTALSRAIGMLHKAFEDIWNETFGSRLVSESQDRPKLRSGGSRIATPTLVDTSKLRH